MKNNKKGFTLVELVIVVAVMAILVAVAIPTVGTITTQATNATRQSNANTIESMIKLYEAKNIQDGRKTGISLDECITACNEAKLGITADTYYYITSNGSVEANMPTENDIEYFEIVFDVNGTASGTEYNPGATIH